MRDYIILNNKNSNEIKGLLIQNLPPITKPRIRAEIEEIDGRDGDIVTPLGYGAYDKVFSIGLYGDFDINEVIKYFDSEGIVVFSNEPNKYYNYKILEQIDFEKLIRFRTADVMMHVQPFKYSTTEGKETEEMETKTASGSEIDLPDTNNEKLQMEKLKGDTTQYNHDSVNMLPNDMATLSLYGITITKNDDGTYTINGTTTQDFNWAINDTALNLQANTNYFLSGCATGGDAETYCLYISAYADTGNGVLINSSRAINDQVRIFIASGQTFNNAIFKPMLIEGTEAIPFEPYGMTTPSPQYPSEVKVVKGENVVSVSGKNLLNVPNTFSVTTSANITASLNAGTYTISLEDYETNVEVGSSFLFQFLKDNTLVTDVYLTMSYKKATKAIPSEVDKIRIYASSNYNNSNGKTTTFKNLMIEQNSTVTPYVPYSKTDYPINLGDIELCKINTYKDYFHKDSGKWYVHKAIGKKVVTSSEILAQTDSYSKVRYFKFNKNTDDIDYNKYNNADIYYTSAKNVKNVYTYDNEDMIGKISPQAENICYWLGFPKGTTLAQAKEKLVGSILYYILATPTEEEITDTSLIAQLEALDNIYNQKGTTYIKTNPEANNMPLSLDVSYTESRPITITNSGNIYSKPIFTIYGEGNIGVYLNDIQLFDINLGSEEQITIDVAEMQAYNKETKALKNRLVTGNYDNFVLKVGENKISFSGIVKKFEIENYSRWI